MIIPNPTSWLEISASAFAHNVSQYKQVIGSGLLAPVIKSNAYGHGMVEIAQLCEQNNHVDWLCVVKLSEALTLRAQGIKKPILILGFIDQNPKLAINKNISFACSDYQSAHELNIIAKQAHSVINIHLKVDTGLARFGAPPDQALSLITAIAQLSFVKITGIWSHCVESHKADQLFTQEQIKTFNTVINHLASHNIHIPIKHMGNSAATTTRNLSFCNFFRIGLGIYGYWPSESTQIITQHQFPHFSLKPVARWKTRIMHIKTVTAGNSIGYDRTAYAQQDTIIALIPVGYDDGYSPFLANKALVGIDNSCAPIIGRIAMNVTAVDITHIKNAHIGQEVTLLGDNEQYNAHTLARHMQINNPRYITTNINASVARIIVE